MAVDSKLGSVLEPLYAAVLETGRLEDFMQALCVTTDSDVGALMAHDVGNAGGRLDLLVGVDPAHMALYEQEYATENPWMQRGAHLMRGGAVVDSDAIMPRAELRRTRYYNEYLRIGGVEQSIALCAQADAEGVVVATLSRGGARPALDARQQGLLRDVAPHWANAYAIQRRLSWLERRVQTLEAAVDESPLATVLLDTRGRVVRMSAVGESLFRRGGVLRLQQGRPESLQDAAAFGKMLHDATAGLHDGTRQAGTLVLRDLGGRNAVAAGVHPCSGRADAAALLFLQPVGGGVDLAGALRQLFALTPSEATLASELHRHADLALAADACGIARTTAQTRLKLVYDKTGERGQAALMRLLSAMAAVCS